MPHYANQKTIIIHKEKVDGLFFQIPQEALFNAVKTLTHAGLKLWLYLAKNNDGFKLDFSPAHAKEQTGLSPSSKDRAIKELIETGYLISTNEGYEFYSTPQANLDDVEKQLEQEMVKYEPGKTNICDSLV